MFSRALGDLCQRIYRISRGKALISVSRQLLLTSLQGIGLLSLLPVLYASGYGGNREPGGAVSQMTGWLKEAGVEFSLGTILAAYAIAIILVSGLRQLQSLYASRLQLDIAKDISLELIETLNRAPWPKLAQSRHSRITQSLADDLKQIGFATALVFQLFGTASTLAVNLLVAVVVSWKLALPTIVAMLALWLAIRPLHKSTSLMGGELRKSRERFFDQLSENLDALKLIRIHGKETQQNERFRRIQNETANQERDFKRSQSKALWYFESLAACLLALFVYAAIVWMQLPMSSVLLLILVYARSLPLLSKAQQHWQNLSHALPFCQAFEASLEALAKNGSSSGPSVSNGKGIRGFNESIDVEGISFSYAGHTVFRDASLSIPAKQTTAISGVSGSGKSTLADLVSGLFYPQIGSIRVDGIDLNPSNAESWRSQIAYVPQENVLFHASIRDNLRWMNPKATESQMLEALTTAKAMPFIDPLPDGIDTIAGERGARFSGGERQRIALARALISDPSFLILDEATNALDMESESQIHDALQSIHGQMAILLITHDSRITAIADRRYRIEKNQVLSDHP